MNTIVLDFANSRNNEVKTINGEFFIIPNSASSYSGRDTEDLWDRAQEKHMARFGYIPEKGEKFIQIWAVTPEDEDSNWESHYWEFAKLTGIEGDRFPMYLPYNVIQDLKEGDILELHREDGYVFKIRANQLKYRYRRFGRFEEVLDRLIPTRQWEHVEA